MLHAISYFNKLFSNGGLSNMCCHLLSRSSWYDAIQISRIGICWLVAYSLTYVHIFAKINCFGAKHLSYFILNQSIISDLYNLSQKSFNLNFYKFYWKTSPYHVENTTILHKPTENIHAYWIQLYLETIDGFYLQIW
jgi:hypothetical protein